MDDLNWVFAENDEDAFAYYQRGIAHLMLDNSEKSHDDLEGAIKLVLERQEEEGAFDILAFLEDSDSE